jgi:hypothetical protein
MPGIVDRPSLPGRQKYGKWHVRRTEIGTSELPNYAALKDAVAKSEVTIGIEHTDAGHEVG